MKGNDYHVNSKLVMHDPTSTAFTYMLSGLFWKYNDRHIETG